jgi:hypothetical protein
LCDIWKLARCGSPRVPKGQIASRESSLRFRDRIVARPAAARRTFLNDSGKIGGEFERSFITLNAD